MIVKCSKCGVDMVIDEPDGEAYIQEADGSIHHVECPTGSEETPPEG